MRRRGQFLQCQSATGDGNRHRKPIVGKHGQVIAKRAVYLLLGLVSACATPARMHDEAQLNEVATGCGLALGEIIQDESEKRLLLTIRQDPTPQQRVCVVQWARKNGLKPVFVNMQFPEG